MKHIVKSNKRVQDFSMQKLQKSIMYSLQAVHATDEEIEHAVFQVSGAVSSWLDNKHEVTTKDIRTFTTRELAKYNKDAVVLYKKHKDLW